MCVNVLLCALAHSHATSALAVVQVRWTKTVGGASDRQGGEAPPTQHNETLRIEKITRNQGGRYYCKAENGLGSPAIHSIRVDVYCEHTRIHTYTAD